MTIFDFLATALVTILVIVDPPGLAPMFLAVTSGMEKQDRRSVAFRAMLIATGVLCFFALVGEPFLRLLGITTAAFRIAGGILLFWIAFEMVFERRNARKASSAETAITIDHIRNVAAFPLAIPLMAGPGAITATMLLSAQTEGDPLKFGILIGVIAVTNLACYLVYRVAEPFDRLLGVTGNVVLSRLLGIILAALAIQFVVDGAKAAFGGA
jgi:multiple antibiotic resistance protein